MTIQEALRRYLSEFPGFRGGKLHGNYLTRSAGAFTLDAQPGDTALHRYMDGSECRRATFLLASCWYYGEDETCQEEMEGLFSGLERWLRQKAAAGALPDLGESAVCLRLTVTPVAYLQSAAGDGLGRYQTEVTAEYFVAAVEPVQ